MGDHQTELDFDLELGDLNSLSSAKSPEPASKMASGEEGFESPQSPPGLRARFSRQRPWPEVAKIAGGVFLAAAVFAWVMVTFVFVEESGEDTSVELPRDPLESVIMELPLGEIRHESISPKPAKGPHLVFIVEIDAAVIVQGTAGELVEMEKLLKSHHHRIEEAVDETIRSASPADLTEPDALTLRTRIRDRINKFIGKPIVKEIVFSHYRAFYTPIKT